MNIATPLPDTGEVMKHVRHMAARMPYRKSGLGQDLVAARYVVDVLQGYGLEASLQEFETYDSDPGTASLELLGAGGRSIEARPCVHIEPTSPEGFRGELIHVNAGGESDYEGKSVQGKIVLAEVSYAPATPEKARLAAKHGAAGIILMNWGLSDDVNQPWRGLKAVWGNPTPGTFHDIPKLFGLSISRRDGEELRNRLASGPVELLAKVTASRVWRKLSQPVAWLRAPEHSPERQRFVIVSGHLDSWNPGVTDNITGNAAMMEIARMLALKQRDLRRSVVFCFWNGHEVAEAAGSTYFVDAMWERIHTDAVAYLNLDSLGMKGTSEFHIDASPELIEFSEALARKVMDETLPIRSTHLSRIGDQSFFGVGVSAVTGRHGYDGATVDQYHGATLGWYNHTEHDTLDVVDECILARDVQYWARCVEELATRPVLPQRFLPRVDDLRQRFQAMLAGKRDPAELAMILPLIDRLRVQVEGLDHALVRLESDGDEEARAPCNALCLRLARLLTFISSSTSGKYGQDSYGVSTLALPIPMLHALEDYQAVEPDSVPAKLLATELMRLRHVITDALETASAHLAAWERGS